VRILAYTRVIHDDGGRIRWIVWASEDVGGLRALRAERQDLTERLRLALDAAQLGTWRWDIATGAVHWDERMMQLYGLAPGGFGGTFDDFAAAIHPDDRSRVLATIEQAVAARARYRVEHRVVSADGAVRWVHGAGQITVAPSGEPEGAIGCAMDVTEQAERRLAVERAAEASRDLAEQERVNRERFEFLAAVNDAVADARTVDEVVHRFVRAAVPRLGDWCSVHLVSHVHDADPEVVTYHVDPELVAWIESLSERYPYDPNATTGIAHVIRTGEVEFHPEITTDVIDDALARAGYDDDATNELRDVLDRLRLRSSITVPLAKLGRTLGGITFATTTDGRHYTTEDLDLARAVAGRVAASIENRRLADHQREIASTLQRSLLPTSLPDIEGIDLAVRYWAAGEGNEVGGDFYDVFAASPGRWATVIGDVCGKGPEAAAVTGLARHAIRQAVWRGDDGPTVFRWLNRMVGAAEPRTFLTAALVSIAAARTGFDLEVTLAGHPWPVLVSADGHARRIGSAGSVLGWFAEIDTTSVTEHLDAGDTLVLYTDGISDVPPPNLLGPDEVTRLIAEAVRGGSTASQMADRLEHAIADRVTIADRPDDIAIVVLHAA
jgi:PAS domain S-box-containing protein